MPPFAILAPRRPRNLHLLGIHRNHFQLCPRDKQVELAARGFPRLRSNTIPVSSEFAAEISFVSA
jgi:hypothetical protein